MARAAYATISLLLFLTACSGDKPSGKLVAGLEERLAQDACLRDLKALRREYRFATRGERIDRNLIDIEIRKAGHRGLPSGKFISEPIDPNSMLLDDGQFFGASATYKVGTNELDLWACGMNFGGVRHMPRF